MNELPLPVPDDDEPSGALPATGLARGVQRLLTHAGYRTLVELPLGNGRRVDVIGLSRHARVTIVEVKASVADFRADAKWPEYLPYCDYFYFAVGQDFPLDLLPPGAGVMVADPFQAAIVRPATLTAMNAQRRRTLILRFARTAAARLGHLLDPDP